MQGCRGVSDRNLLDRCQDGVMEKEENGRRAENETCQCMLAPTALAVDPKISKITQYSMVKKQWVLQNSGLF